MGLTMYSMAIKGTSKEHRLAIKQEVVRYAQVYGKKPAVRKFGVSRGSVREWVRRYEEEGIKGLLDRRCGPNSIPHKMDEETEGFIISIKKEYSYMGARSIRYYFGVNHSRGAIQRVINQNGLQLRRRKRWQRKRDLRAEKAKYKSFTYLQMDIKYLRDIPNYWPQMTAFNLPRYQYTMRDVKTGWVFLGYSDEISELNARTMATYVVSRMIEALSIEPRDILIQTDNGSEFSGAGRSVRTAAFVRTLVEDLGVRHAYIPPGCCNANADVESFHNTVENECFDRIKIRTKEEFFNTIETYRVWYNLTRVNFSKNQMTPLTIMEKDYPNECDQGKLICISAIDLDKIAAYPNPRSGGHSFPGLPD